jgi:hypothetical protein
MYLDFKVCTFLAKGMLLNHPILSFMPSATNLLHLFKPLRLLVESQHLKEHNLDHNLIRDPEVRYPLHYKEVATNYTEG